MDTTAYILNDYDAFNLKTKISKIKTFFNATTFSHFPIVENSMLVGMISETDINSIDDDSKDIGDFRYLLNLFYTEKALNFIEFLKQFSLNEANILPVLNANKEYIGYYNLIDVLHLFNDTNFFEKEGIIVSLEKETNTFSISEISQIIETNKGTVLGVFVTDNSANKTQVLVKFDAVDFNDIIQSFRRYDYTILSNHKEDFYLEDLKERSHYLQKYLNI